MHPNSSTRSIVSLPFSRRYTRASEIPILVFLDQQEKPKTSSALSRPSLTTTRSTKCLVGEIRGQSALILPCFVFVTCSYLRFTHLQSTICQMTLYYAAMGFGTSRLQDESPEVAGERHSVDITENLTTNIFSPCFFMVQDTRGSGLYG